MAIKNKLQPKDLSTEYTYNEFHKIHKRCKWCEGTGMAYRFEDRDVIEGYKLADKKICLHCEGLGQTADDKIIDEYYAYVDSVRNYNEKIENENEIIKSIRFKLGPKEIEFIEALF